MKARTVSSWVMIFVASCVLGAMVMKTLYTNKSGRPYVIHKVAEEMSEEAVERNSLASQPGWYDDPEKVRRYHELTFR